MWRIYTKNKEPYKKYIFIGFRFLLKIRHIRHPKENDSK